MYKTSITSATNVSLMCDVDDAFFFDGFHRDLRKSLVLADVILDCSAFYVPSSFNKVWRALTNRLYDGSAGTLCNAVSPHGVSFTALVRKRTFASSSISFTRAIGASMLILFSNLSNAA